MKYTLTVKYNDTTGNDWTATVDCESALLLAQEMVLRMVDNETHHNVESWTITPAPPEVCGNCGTTMPEDMDECGNCGLVTGATPSTKAEEDDIDPTARHTFTGRLDRYCEVKGCNLPDRAEVHKILKPDSMDAALRIVDRWDSLHPAAPLSVAADGIDVERNRRIQHHLENMGAGDPS